MEGEAQTSSYQDNMKVREGKPEEGTGEQHERQSENWK